VVFFLYGGMVWGVFPSDPEISYESHLSGALTGIALAFLLRRLDAPPPARQYSWEEEPEEPTILENETDEPSEADRPSGSGGS
jgi:hypothetical protein